MNLRMSGDCDADAMTALRDRAGGRLEAVEVGAGWAKLLVDLDCALAEIDSDYAVHQVKSKFGELRFYAYANSDDPFDRARFDALIAQAERESATLCEQCGQPARRRITAGWSETLCDLHAYPIEPK